jgi:uncharacterized protein (TIGR02246 family)
MLTTYAISIFMKTLALLASISLTLASPAFAQAPADTAEKTAIAATDRAYEAAYAKADAKTLGDFFADDAEYTNDEGRTVSGRAQIEAAIRAALLARKGGKIAITADSVRALSPDVLVEKGATTVTHKNGETSDSLFTAIYVKKDGKWKISQLVESPTPSLTAGDRLSELGWLIGSWEEVDKASDSSVRSQYVLARGGNFITRNITVKRGGETTLEGWQIIGWDPVEERIRSWTFDGEGGFADGRWTRDGDRWLVREAGVAPDGGRTGSDSTITKLGNDRIAWESNNRTLDGEPQPSIGRIEINRTKGQ